MSGKIELERRTDGVVMLWIDNPAHRNALNNSLIETLAGHYRSLAADPSCRAIVVRGRGGIFCAGASSAASAGASADASAAISADAAFFERLRAGAAATTSAVATSATDASLAAVFT